MAKIKVLYHLNQLGFGGTEKAILTFAKNIDRSQFDILLFVPVYHGSFRYYRHKVLSLLSQKYRRRLEQLLIHNMASFSEFQKVFGKENVIVDKWSNFVSLLKKNKVDIVHFNRGEKEDAFTAQDFKIPQTIAVVETNIFARQTNKNYWSRLKKSFFVSQYCLDKSPWHNGKGEVLFNPIRAPKEMTHLRQELGIPPNAVVLGQIGRPDLYQDEWVYEAYQASQDLGIHLVVLGCTKKIKELKKNTDRIHLIEATTDLAKIDQFYRTIDILLHRRLDGETFGMNIAEALISGVPVVSHLSRVDNAQKELLDSQGFGPVGFVAHLDDKESYKKFARDLIVDSKLRETFGRNAKEKAMALYEEKVVTLDLQNKYKAVLTAHKNEQ